jgi:hypothetical protein
MDNENRFLRCAMDYKLSAMSPRNELDNRFMRCAIEHRVEQERQQWQPRKQPRQVCESVNARVERLRKEKYKSYDDEFPSLTPPASPQLVPIAPIEVKGPPPGFPTPVSVKWADAVRTNEKSSLQVQKSNSFPTSVAASVAAAVASVAAAASYGKKKSSKEEDIVFDDDGFPHMRMIESLYE